MCHKESDTTEHMSHTDDLGSCGPIVKHPRGLEARELPFQGQRRSVCRGWRPRLRTWWVLGGKVAGVRSQPYCPMEAARALWV